MSKVYQIKHYERHYEVARSREIDRKSWGTHPIKRGMGYLRLVRRKNGPALYGAFLAVKIICDGMTLPREGWLTSDGRSDGEPFDVDDMAALTHFPAALIKEMLEACSTSKVDWVVTYNSDGTTLTPERQMEDTEPVVNDAAASAKATPRKEQVSEWWNTLAKKHGFRKLTKMTDDRWAKFKGRLSEGMWERRAEIGKAAQSSTFLREGSWFGFDWLCKNPTNWLKVVEGNYVKGKGDERKTPAPRPAPVNTEVEHDNAVMKAVDFLWAAKDRPDELAKRTERVTKNASKYGKNKAGQTVIEAAEEVINFRQAQKSENPQELRQ